MKIARSRGWIALALPLIVSPRGSAEEEESEGGQRLRSLRQLCTAAETTGFNWEKGRWVLTRFTNEQFVVVKVEPPKDIREAVGEEEVWKSSGCSSQFDEKEQGIPGLFRHYNACLRVHNVQEQASDYFGCTEAHDKQGADEASWGVRLACPSDGFYMEPDGYFHRAFVHWHLEREPKDDYKESLAIAVGTCVSIDD